MTAITGDQWAVTAYHESGHIAGYLHFGWKFGPVKIYQAADGRIKGFVTSPAGTYDPFGRAICCLAGPLAEAKLTGIGLAEQPDSYVDVTMAREALRRIGSGDFDSVSVITRLLIDQQWPRIQRLASELLSRKELDYDAVVRLVHCPRQWKNC
jgi:hypothetical protein